MRAILASSIRMVPWSVRRTIRHIPVVAWVQRKLISWMLEGREFVHEVDAGPARGLRYPVILPDDKGVWTGTYELEFFQRIAADIKPGMVCLDIGGFRGFGAGVMAGSGASTVYIFEPLPANCQRIQRLIELNKNFNIVLQNMAIGDSIGSASFHLMQHASMGKLDNSPFQDAVKAATQIQVQLTTLDAWFENCHEAQIGVIKVDVEGAELMVLRGAEKLLRSQSPYLYVEAHSRDLTKEVTRFLQAAGYDVIALETGRVPDGSTEPDVCHLRAAPK